MSKLGASLLADLLGLDSGHRGPRIDCGAGHQAEFVSYRDKSLDTVLGPVTLSLDPPRKYSRLVEKSSELV
ncbi:MAG: hypothetical protein ACYDDU_19970 [Dermatophilaceae bacterium]